MSDNVIEYHRCTYSCPIFHCGESSRILILIPVEPHGLNGGAEPNFVILPSLFKERIEIVRRGVGTPP